MSIFVVETYVVKSEKRDDFTPALKEFLEFKETHTELFMGLMFISTEKYPIFQSK